MYREQVPHLVGDMRSPTNKSFGVNYCVGQCVTLAPSYLTRPILYTSNKTTTAKFDSLLQSVLPNGVFNQHPENRITQAKHSMVDQNWKVTLIQKFRVATALYCITQKDHVMWRRLQKRTIPLNMFTLCRQPQDSHQ